MIMDFRRLQRSVVLDALSVDGLRYTQPNPDSLNPKLFSKIGITNGYLLNF